MPSPNPGPRCNSLLAIRGPAAAPRAAVSRFSIGSIVMPTRRLAAWHKPLVTSQACIPACPRASRASVRSRTRGWIRREWVSRVLTCALTVWRALLRREDGIAMLTVLMLTIILTVIGVAAITSTSLDIKMAGGERLRESTLNAAEACMSSGVQIIQQTLQNGGVPGTLTAACANQSITLPLGTAPAQNPPDADSMGQSNASAHTAGTTVGSTRNAVLTISTYTVNMDIDRLYAQPMSGAPAAFGGSAQQAGVQIIYRID